MILLITLWTILVFSSIAWYAFLLFYIGYKGGVEIRQMTKDLGERNDAAAQNKPDEK